MLRMKEYTDLENTGHALRGVRNIAACIHSQKLNLVFGLLIGGIVGIALASGLAHADAGHGHDDEREGRRVEQMIEQHKGHSHGHEFKVMEKMSPEEMGRLMHEMEEIGLAIPPMDSHEGRELFLSKGCVACHEVNGVGGHIGPSLNASDMPKPMNAFEFAARMWRGAPAMAQMQESLLGEMIALDGQELADLVAFAHDAGEQQELTKDQVPERFRALLVK